MTDAGGAGMYQPAEFRPREPSTLVEHLRSHPFGVLVSHGDAGFAASHLPFLVAPDARTLTGHLARRNPQVHAIADGTGVLAVFPGPQAYVSARWYTAEPDVPTWNYTAVHVHGTFRRLPGGATMDVLRRTVATFEGDDAAGWRLDALDADLVDGLAHGVVAFEIDVDRVEGGVKLSQDKLAADVTAVVDGLRSTGRPDATEVAAAMEEHGVRGRTGTATTDPATYRAATDRRTGEC